MPAAQPEDMLSTMAAVDLLMDIVTTRLDAARTSARILILQVAVIRAAALTILLPADASQALDQADLQRIYLGKSSRQSRP